MLSANSASLRNCAREKKTNKHIQKKARADQVSQVKYFEFRKHIRATYFALNDRKTFSAPPPSPLPMEPVVDLSDPPAVGWKKILVVIPPLVIRQNSTHKISRDIRTSSIVYARMLSIKKNIMEVLLSTSILPHEPFRLKEKPKRFRGFHRDKNAQHSKTSSSQSRKLFFYWMDILGCDKARVIHQPLFKQLPPPSPSEQIDRVNVSRHFDRAMCALRMSLTAKTSSSSISTTVSSLLATFCSISAYFCVSSPNSCYKNGNPFSHRTVFFTLLLNRPRQSNSSRRFGVHERVL